MQRSTIFSETGRIAGVAMLLTVSLLTGMHAQSTLTVRNRFLDSESNYGEKGRFTVAADEDFTNPNFTQSGSTFNINPDGWHWYHSEYPNYDNSGLGLVDTRYQFQAWDASVEDYLFTKAHEFNQDQKNHESWFRFTRPASLHVEKDDNRIDDAILDVLNPWNIAVDESYGDKYNQHTDYVRTTDDADRRYEYNGNGGAHVQKEPDPNNSNQRYFSLRAPRYLNFEGTSTRSVPLSLGDMLFHHWESENASIVDDPHHTSSGDYQIDAIVFANNATNTGTAWYKGHRVSTLEECPTNINSQRKIAVDDEDIYHLVYESSNTIWYTRSTDEGLTWDPEREVSEFDADAHRPSLSYWNGRLYVAYVEGSLLFLKIYDLSGNYFWDYLNSYDLSDPALCNPVIEASNGCVIGTDPDIVMVVWEDEMILKYRCIEMTSPLLTELFDGALGGGTRSVQPRYPALSVGNASYYFDLVWTEGTHLFYSKIMTRHCNIPDVQIDPDAVLVNTNSYEPATGAPTLTSDPASGQPGLTYESSKSRFVYDPRRYPPILVITDNSIICKGSADSWQKPWFTWTTKVVNYRMNYGTYGLMRPTVSMQPAEPNCQARQRRIKGL